MYNILIVDDEKIIADVLEEYFYSNGSFKVFCATNGLEALELWKPGIFDAIIIDIIMPQMDGIKLLEELENRNDTAVKIVISAHDDYNFVRHAMVHNVTDYLLKPFYPDDLEKLVAKVKKIIYQRQKRQLEHQNLLLAVEKGQEKTRQQFFESLFNYWPNKDASSQYHLLQNDNLADSMFQVALIKFDYTHVSNADYSHIYQTNMTITSETVSRVAESYEECIYHKDNLEVFILLFRQTTEQQVMHTIEELFEEIHRELSDLNITTYGGVGNTVTDIFSARLSYRQALTALKHNVYFKFKNILHISDIEAQDVNAIHLLDEEVFVSDLKLVNKKEITSYFESLHHIALRDEINPTMLELVLVKILLLTETVVFELNIEDYQQLSLQCQKLTTVIREAIIPEEQISQTHRLVIQVIGNIKKSRIHKNSQNVERIKKYIQKNYSQEISIGNISKVVGLSKNYISQIFKQETAMSLIEYVHRIRINKAKRIIETTDAKIYMVAFQVGYRDQHYFSSVFKRFSGISPSEYREFYPLPVTATKIEEKP